MGALRSIKQYAIDHLLAREKYFLIVIDPRVRHVELPDHLMQSNRPVGIHIGREMTIPIPDLTISEFGIAGTLSFDGQAFRCSFPWDSVTQISVGTEHMVYMEDVKRDQVTDESEANEASPSKADAAMRKRTKKPTLRLVK